MIKGPKSGKMTTAGMLIIEFEWQLNNAQL